MTVFQFGFDKEVQMKWNKIFLNKILYNENAGHVHSACTIVMFKLKSSRGSPWNTIWWIWTEVWKWYKIVSSCHNTRESSFSSVMGSKSVNQVNFTYIIQQPLSDKTTHTRTHQSILLLVVQSFSLKTKRFPLMFKGNDNSIISCSLFLTLQKVYGKVCGSTQEVWHCSWISPVHTWGSIDQMLLLIMLLWHVKVKA